MKFDIYLFLQLTLRLLQSVLLESRMYPYLPKGAGKQNKGINLWIRAAINRVPMMSGFGAKPE